MKTNLIYWIEQLAEAKKTANHNSCAGNLIAVRGIHKEIAKAALEVIKAEAA